MNSVVKRVGYCQRAFDMEDMYQEANIAYLSACDTYDESKEASLATYASKKIYWTLQDFLRSPYMEGVSKEEFYGLMDESLEQPDAADAYEESEDKVYMEPFDEIFYRVYRQKKSKSVRLGILGIRDEVLGKDKRGTADEFGVTTRYLAACKERAREALEPYMDEIRALLD